MRLDLGITMIFTNNRRFLLTINYLKRDQIKGKMLLQELKLSKKSEIYSLMSKLLSRKIRKLKLILALMHGEMKERKSHSQRIRKSKSPILQIKIKLMII